MTWCSPCTFLKLDNESLRIALGLRLGVPIVAEQTCVCGSKVDVFCTQVCLAGHVSQHTAVNETIHHALVSEGVPADLEPVGVCRKRPDGMSLIPWWWG